MTLETLIHQFQTRALPRELWTHRAHLGVALWTLRRCEWDESLERLRREIRAYNESIGVENGPFSGYHETISQFFAGRVREFIAENAGHDDEDQLWAELSDRWGDKNAIFGWYSRRYLFSPAARFEFAPPDLKPNLKPETAAHLKPFSRLEPRAPASE